MSVYVLIAIMRKRLLLDEFSLYQISQVLSVTPFEKIAVNSMFFREKLQNLPEDSHKQLSFLDL